MIVNIRELNPTGNENAIFAIRTVGSENPDTIVGFVNFFLKSGLLFFLPVEQGLSKKATCLRGRVA